MEQLDAISIVRDIIKNNLRHRDYKHTVDLAKEYKTFITGKDIDEYMKKFPRRETEKEFKQRVDLTINITPTICGNVIDPQKKVSRSNSIERTFLYTETDDEKHNALKDIISKFWDNQKTVEEYMAEVWIETNNIDPNSFFVIDWKTNTEGQRIRPYPVEYPSESVYHYNKKNGELEWVCVHRDEDGFDPEMYILYGKNFTVLFTKSTETMSWNYDADILYYQDFPVENVQGPVATFKQTDDIYWEVSIPVPHNLGYVPGRTFGHVRDLSTNGRTYLSTIHKAMPLLKKIVKANSELDFSMLLHAFQQKAVYVDPCTDCNHGRTREGNICEKCEGTGQNPEQIHSSGLDIVRITRPRDMSREDTVPLRDLVHYYEPNTAILKFQDEYVDKLSRKCKEAVYNSEVFSRKDVAETAYGKNIDLQNVYDALWGLAVNYANSETFMVNCVADVCNLNENLIYRTSFRKDFKMKSLTDLYMDLVTVGTSNADEFVKKAVEDDIAQILYEDDPRSLLRYKTENYFFPFNGKTKKEIELIINNSMLIKEETKVLWANFSYIFDELELEFAEKKIDFYKVTRKGQKEAIAKKVKDIMDKLEKPDIYVGEAVFGNGGKEQSSEARPVEENKRFS